MGIVFKDVIASGADMFAPSASRPPTRPFDNDCYRPTFNDEEEMEEEEEDLTEWSGDSQDDSFGERAVGVSAEFEGMNIQQNSQHSGPSHRSGSGSLGKRKRDGRWGKQPKKKGPPSHVISSTFSEMAVNSKSNARGFKCMVEKTTKKDPVPSAAELSLEIYALEEITFDPNLLTRCLNMLASYKFRDIFATVVANRRDHMVDFLKYNADNPNPLFK